MLPWWFWVVIVVLLGVFLWSVVSPRSQWRLFQSWAYRDAEANEPSDAAYALTRVAGVVAIAVILFAAVNLAALQY
jgi:hypothetical protein